MMKVTKVTSQASIQHRKKYIKNIQIKKKQKQKQKHLI
jgi:hypothetical protein